MKRTPSMLFLSIGALVVTLMALAFLWGVLGSSMDLTSAMYLGVMIFSNAFCLGCAFFLPSTH